MTTARRTREGVIHPGRITNISPVNLPNWITLGRLGLTAVFVIGISFPGPVGYLVAIVSFIIAAISDWLDGYLARKLNLVTNFGKLIDPLADKILTSSAFLFLAAHEAHLCPVWAAILILGREFLVTGLRQLAVEQGKVIAADWSGKWKTTFQLTFCITALIWIYLDSAEINFFVTTLSKPGGYLQQISLWGAVILTVFSGLQYAWNSRDLFRFQ